MVEGVQQKADTLSLLPGSPNRSLTGRVPGAPPTNEESNTMQGTEMFSIRGKVAVVAGGGGVLGGAIAEGLASAGAQVAVADLLPEMAGKE